MAGRAQKGERFGGRVKGTPNKTTTERIERERIARQAQQEVDKANLAKVKLGKDILEDYVGAFHNIAAVYQNRIATAYASGQEPKVSDIAAFKEWGGMVVSTAKNLADFQSPKFKAIAVIAPPPNQPPPPSTDAKGNVIEMTKDPIALARIYQQMIKKPA